MRLYHNSSASANRSPVRAQTPIATSGRPGIHRTPTASQIDLTHRGPGTSSNRSNVGPIRTVKKLHPTARANEIHYDPTTTITTSSDTVAASSSHPVEIVVDGIRKQCEHAADIIRLKQKATMEAYHRNVCSGASRTSSPKRMTAQEATSRPGSPTKIHTMHRRYFPSNTTNETHFTITDAAEPASSRQSIVGTSKKKVEPTHQEVLPRRSVSPGKRRADYSDHSKCSSENPLVPRNVKAETASTAPTQPRPQPLNLRRHVMGAVPSSQEQERPKGLSRTSSPRHHSTISLDWKEAPAQPSVSPRKAVRTASPPPGATTATQSSGVVAVNKNSLLWGNRDRDLISHAPTRNATSPTRPVYSGVARAPIPSRNILSWN
eukprot:PhM_4_TR10156/c0_g1_i1/m.7809